MTTATAFAPLLAPVLDDSMEVSSSPAGNQYDDEVLIDYDDYGTAAHPEDERMIEDGEQTRPGTATDDMMEDDEPSNLVDEEIMHDDPVTVAPETNIEDEELIDYSDDEYQDDTQVTLDDTTATFAEAAKSSFVAPAENAHEADHVDDAIVQQPDDQGAVEVEEPTAHFLSAVAETANQDQVLGTADKVVAAVGEDDARAGTVEQSDAADELSRQIDPEEAAAQELEAQALEADEVDVQETDLADDQQVNNNPEVLKQPPKFPSGLDTSAYFAPDGPHTPSDTGIHPITIRYGDIVMPLFKSRAQPDGLLKDDNLASVSLGDLLDSCRQRLAVKIGENVSADQELVLSFENMGLQVIEHSPHAFGTSLDDVLQVYLKLHQNDATNAIPALALSLSLQLKFTSSLNILKAAAEHGEGMSKFAYLRSGAEEVDEYEEEEHEEHDAYDENEAAGEEDQHYGDDGASAEHLEDGEASNLEGQEYEGQENQEESHEHEADESYEGHQDETNYEEYEEQQQTDPHDGIDHHDDVGKSLEESAGAREENEASIAEVAAEDEASHFFADAVQESDEPVQPESTASSETVRGDMANDPTGEYCDMDFIDFEDDDLTTYTAELNVEDGNDDLSALEGESHAGDDVADATAPGNNQQPVAEAADATSDAFAFDFPGETGDQQLIEELNGEEADEDAAAEDTPHGVGSDVGQHGQEEDPHADNLDLNEDDLPDENDEQLDTAFDLLEDHDFENGAQNGEPAQTADDFDFDDDDIGFNDDVEEAVLASNSPLGKRSFDEHVGKDVVREEQELKKARSG